MYEIMVICSAVTVTVVIILIECFNAWNHYLVVVRYCTSVMFDRLRKRRRLRKPQQQQQLKSLLLRL